MNTFATQILLQQLKSAHDTLEQTVNGVTDEVARFIPPGKANPIAGTYAHVVFSEDLFVSQFLKNTQPLYETAFKGKTGASEVQPTDWAEAYPRWLRDVTLDIETFREYAHGVYEATEEFLASLNDDGLDKDVDMSAFGMGSRKVYDIIGNLITGHVYPIMGEISVLKGIQGLKGYPF